jgi:hypothetical protein
MRPKYSKRTVDEAVQLLDVYASQMATLTTHLCLSEIQAAIGASSRAFDLAYDAWRNAPLPTDRAVTFEELRECGAEAAQRLREGWRP